MKVIDLLKNLNRFAPQTLAEDWDNVGLMVGRLQAPVKGILVALDPRIATVTEAIKKNLWVWEELVIFLTPQVFILTHWPPKPMCSSPEM